MLNKAIQEAAVAHGDQKRTDTDIPYITHPFMVAMILSEAGYTKDEVVAGVLHDTLEDTELTEDCTNIKPPLPTTPRPSR